MKYLIIPYILVCAMIIGGGMMVIIEWGTNPDGGRFRPAFGFACLMGFMFASATLATLGFVGLFGGVQ